MSFFSTFKAKVRAMCLLLGALLVAFVVSGCGNSSDDYVGTWMGINEIGYGNSKVYEFDIELDRNSEGAYQSPLNSLYFIPELLVSQSAEDP